MTNSTAPTQLKELIRGLNSTSSDVVGSAGLVSIVSHSELSLFNLRAYRRALIGSIKDVCGGDPIILGTRISVALIVDLHYRLGWDIRRIMDEYPELRFDQVKAALEYYEEKPREVDSLIQQEREVGRS